MTRYFRFGKPSRVDSYFGHYVSGNHRDGSTEEGLSVYVGDLYGGVLTLDLRDVDQLSALFIIDANDCWEILGGRLIRADWPDSWGGELGRRARGADGEPLLYGFPEELVAGIPGQPTGPIIPARQVSVSSIRTIR